MSLIEIQISQKLKEINPVISLGIIESRVTNSSHNEALWERINTETSRIRESLSFEEIKDIPHIAATRKVYSACGKDPSRYRPSAEALMRRIVKGQDLYRINTLVDIINYLSLHSGYSIGAFDASLIEGSVEAGIGRSDEIYNAIGRGLLNIENLPVLRDAKGSIGSPTSDEERTSIRNVTSHMLIVIYGFDGPDDLPSTMDLAVELLKQHAMADILNYQMLLPK